MTYYFIFNKQKNVKKIGLTFSWRFEGHGRKWKDPDPLVRGADPDPYQNVTIPQVTKLL
jgi:hypothetical protein